MEVKAIERFLYVLRQLFDDYDLADQEIDSTGAPNFWAKGESAITGFLLKKRQASFAWSRGGSFNGYAW
ncbi:MAG TPA: hypothetical protein VHZ64_17690 [Xanthobacteraceae bacterium]|jgi:hypothetical protein|nr:hypothetical protein [Xanthobacteraceae bacterium]